MKHTSASVTNQKCVATKPEEPPVKQSSREQSHCVRPILLSWHCLRRYMPTGLSMEDVS